MNRRMLDPFTARWNGDPTMQLLQYCRCQSVSCRAKCQRPEFVRLLRRSGMLPSRCEQLGWRLPTAVDAHNAVYGGSSLHKQLATCW